jgi:TRAP-type C4-dicarboxylate transport system permease large subunit
MDKTKMTCGIAAGAVAAAATHTPTVPPSTPS